MTSAVGGGSPKSRQKEGSFANHVCDRGGGGKKNPKMLRTSYMEAPKENCAAFHISATERSGESGLGSNKTSKIDLLMH